MQRARVKEAFGGMVAWNWTIAPQRFVKERSATLASFIARLSPNRFLRPRRSLHECFPLVVNGEIGEELFRLVPCTYLCRPFTLFIISTTLVAAGVYAAILPVGSLNTAQRLL